MTVVQQPSEYVPSAVPGHANVRMDKWQCTLHFDGRSKTFTFSLGEGHKGREPEIDEVIEAVVSDASYVEPGVSFADFADVVGYDIQNGERSKARKAYAECQVSRTKLIDLFGQELFDESCSTRW